MVQNADFNRYIIFFPKKYWMWLFSSKWKCWLSPSNGPNEQIKLLPTRWRYPLLVNLLKKINLVHKTSSVIKWYLLIRCYILNWIWFTFPDRFGYHRCDQFEPTIFVPKMPCGHVQVQSCPRVLFNFRPGCQSGSYSRFNHDSRIWCHFFQEIPDGKQTKDFSHPWTVVFYFRFLFLKQAPLFSVKFVGISIPKLFSYFRFWMLWIIVPPEVMWTVCVWLPIFLW